MRVLIISPIELFYEPRLRKAAYYFSNTNSEVDVLCALCMASKHHIYADVKKELDKCNFIEVDISKKDFKSKIRWLFHSIAFKAATLFWKFFSINIFPSNGVLSKSFILSKIPNKEYDYVLVNLIDTLPIANAIKNRTGAKIIYDSQEFFTGQYAQFSIEKAKWVNLYEKKYIQNVDILLATTNIMVNTLIDKYKLSQPSFRVRNTPLKKEIPQNLISSKNKTYLELVWHGKSINFFNSRGVHIIVEATLRSKSHLKLYLQGSISKSEEENLERLRKEINSTNEIILLPPALPTEIVSSLTKYDIGVIGEIPSELNQQYTSSNKLFDFICAGLAVVAPDISGLNETLVEYSNGLTYTPNSIKDLIKKLDFLYQNRQNLYELKEKSIAASSKCYWESEYSNVNEALKNYL